MHMGFPKLVNSHLSDSTSSKKDIGKMKAESSTEYERINLPYLTNKLLNKGSSKKLSKLINLKVFFDDLFEVIQ